MTQLSDLLAEVRALREGLERIEALMEEVGPAGVAVARPYRKTIRQATEALVAPAVAQPPSPFSGEWWGCHNSMHMHLTREEAEACDAAHYPPRGKPVRWYSVHFESDGHVGDTSLPADSEEDARAMFIREHPLFAAAELTIKLE